MGWMQRKYNRVILNEIEFPSTAPQRAVTHARRSVCSGWGKGTVVMLRKRHKPDAALGPRSWIGSWGTVVGAVAVVAAAAASCGFDRA